MVEVVEVCHAAPPELGDGNGLLLQTWRAYGARRSEASAAAKSEFPPQSKGTWELCRLSAEVFCFFVSQLLHLLDHATLDRFGELFDGRRFENAFHVKVDLECVLNPRYETHREERVPAHSEKVVVDSYRWEFQKPEPYFRQGSLREIPRLIHSCISGIHHGAI